MEITIKLSLSDVQVVLAALGKLPLETSINAWLEIKNQAESQIQTRQESTEET